MGSDALGIVESLGHSHAWLEAAEESDDVAPITRLIQIEWSEQIDLCAGRKHRAEVEAGGQDAYYGIPLSSTALPTMAGSALN